MAIDRSKIQKQADTLMASGKVERAIDELLKLVEDSPRDHAMMNRIGDAYLQIQRVSEAVEMFKRAGGGYEREGFTSRAAAVFKKAHRHAPDDEDVASRLAELYRQTNLIKEAMQIHLEMADAFTKKGLLKRALTEFGKVVELDPKNLKNKVKLADLYNKEGMKERAAAIYLEVAEALAMENMHAEATQIMERARTMVSTPQVFLTWSRLCVMKKDLGEAARVLREGVEANARNPEILEALAEVELQRRSPDLALEALGQVPQLPEKALLVCERALKELVKAGRAEDALRLYKPIAREFARRGAGERSAQVLQSVLQMAPSLEGWLLMAELAHQGGNREERVQALQQGFRLAQEAGDAAQIEEITRQLAALGLQEAQFLPAEGSASHPAAQAPLAPMLGEATDVDLNRRFRLDQMHKQAQEFERSRFPDRASEIYQRILEEDPFDLQALERMAEIIKASGRLAAVQQHYLKHGEKLVQLGRPELASRLLDQADLLFPGSTRMHRRMWGLPEAGAAPVPEPPPAFERLPIIPLGAGLPVPPPPAPQPVPMAPAIPEGLEDLDILIALDEGQGEATAAGQPPLAPPPPAPPMATIPLALDAGELQPGDVGEALLPELEPLELEPLPFAEGKAPVVPATIPAPLGAALPLPAAPPAPVVPPSTPAPETFPEKDEELDASLSDIDFQLDYGSPEEAKIEIENALTAWPEHPELLERLARAEERMRMLGHQARPAAPPQEAEPSFFDLTDVLGDVLGEGEEMHDATHVVEKIQSVEELFSAFRDGVEQQVRGDDYDTHYNLGIAYKEMMLIEPAMEEFKKAMRDPERTLECCSMLSICEHSNGNPEAALDWLQKGIETPGFPPEDSIGLRYDRGEILLQMGRVEEARASFREVYAMDPEYREVARRV